LEARGGVWIGFVMAVRDYRELQQSAFEIVPFDFHFDMGAGRKKVRRNS